MRKLGSVLMVAVLVVTAVACGRVLAIHAEDIGAGQWDVWADNAVDAEKIRAARRKANQLCPDGYTVINKDEDSELGTETHHMIKCSAPEGANRN